MRGHPPPRREAGKGVARPIASCPRGGSGYRLDSDTAENLVAGTLKGNVGNGGGGWSVDQAQAGHLIAPPLTGNPYGDDPSREGLLVAETLRSHPRPGSNAVGAVVAHTLRGDGHDASEDGTGRGTPIIPFDTTQITGAANHSNPKAGDPCHPLAAGAHPPAVAFQSKASAHQSMNPSAVAPSLDVGKADGMAVGRPDACQAESARAGSTVRRLSPIEAERLMGLPDNFTAVPHRGKPMADGPRYRLLGNSFAVNVARWIGERIALFESIRPIT